MHYHIIGIAGAGMSAIAHLLLDQGHTVSGSDLGCNRLTEGLVARGARVALGHDPAHVAGAEAVLATAAVRPDHPELVAARGLGLPILKRDDLWREWSQQRQVVAVAGSHGKTTTSAMVAVALRGAGLNPGFLIGAEVPDLGGNATWGDPAAPLVIEADEYDRAFLSLSPALAVITNVEWDHPDIYPSAEEYEAAFSAFGRGVGGPRRLVLGSDGPHLTGLGDLEPVLYGIEERLATDPISCRLAPFDWTASGVTGVPGGGVSFDLWRFDRQRMGQRRMGLLELALPGAHNVRNALAALAVAALLGVDLRGAVAALSTFRGSARRFEVKGEAGGVVVIDDYGHHPSEVGATLAAARMRYPERRIVAYLQPHTFSRTESLLAQWPEACRTADLVLVGDVYAARETGDAAGVAQRLAAQIAAAGVAACYSGDIAASSAALIALVQAGDLVITLGAGDGDRVGMNVLAHVQQVGREAE
ncbi:UDP-N-acetylmuramate--L-alanine ligase [Candidatus Oscillochloris fontis]|uniref:UDP-N-acetylmuramate--L-alanine ligase n=1 Tax=Candidatus Oscillochloris fontis TaxID=2496868 RepID=UPI00101C986E|nr:UDP-N-acetylmuramate--L-alanine ligase [Candidatus Oscillochloris fontis]